MAKDPAFLFYSADFMMGAMTLTMEQRGQYITLLSIMHQKGRLSKEEVEFVIGGTPGISLTKKFKIDDDGNWYNERLETEIAKRSEFTKSRRKSLEIDNGDMVHLYLIKDPETGTVKIGSSKYPELRLKEARKYKPGADFIWISEILFERINEKKLHEEFSKKKIRYDWFDLSKEDIENIRNKYRNGSRTEDVIENENTNDIDLKLKESLDELYLDQQKPKWSHIDFDFEYQCFCEKVRGSPENYLTHTTGGMRLAFQSQLRYAKKKPPSKVEVKKLTLDDLQK